MTARETQIVQAVATGRSNQEIAEELFISLSTVKGHVSGVQAKLGIPNRRSLDQAASSTSVKSTSLSRGSNGSGR
ncbi:response regulator transcription factor [Nonomuraea sp. NPDC004297]